MTNEKEYERFGPQWRAYVMKKSKSDLVDMYRKVCIELQQVKSVDLADVGGALQPKTCKVVNDNDDEFPCDVTTCCGVGPITRENYCPNCGAKIESQ